MRLMDSIGSPRLNLRFADTDRPARHLSVTPSAGNLYVRYSLCKRKLDGIQ